MGIHTEALKDVCKKANYRLVQGRGNFKASTAVILEYPSEQEQVQGIIGVNASGKELDRMMAASGFKATDYYVDQPYKLRPPNDDISQIKNLGIDPMVHVASFYEELYDRKPAIIICCGVTPLSILCPQCKYLPAEPTAKQKKNPFQTMKWRGSLLQSPNLNWPHYIIPCCHPNYIFKDWAERQIAILIMAKAKEEQEYFNVHGLLRPLPSRNINIQPDSDWIVNQFEEYHKKSTQVSVDIETFRNRVNKKNFIYTIAFAESSTEGFSFCFWDYRQDQIVKIFRSMNNALKDNPLIGQNFRIFDSNWLNSIGFEINPYHIDDTLDRHHLLYPEMEHTLQFMTLQYTREPYYKDEGKSLSLKDKTKFLGYGGKDACVTFEVYNEQEKELNS